nr:hypothetical protein [Tanacetum cinerariifolium]
MMEDMCHLDKVVARLLVKEEPKKIFNALKDPSWVEAMQEELLQFKIQKFWILVDCPKGVRPIGTKWVLKNKKGERGIVIRNKARLVAQGHTQEEGIDYKEVFILVARIKAIRLFLAYASFMEFTVYQMDVKSAFLYGTIDEEVYVMQPPGFQDPEHYLSKSTKEISYLFKFLQKKDGVFLSQDKYVGDILKKFGYSDVRSASTPMDKENPWGKDRTGKDVELHMYRSMIGSLMYLTASRLDIMFAVCACARHQVTPKECHLHAVKRIFRYLKGHPKLGLWYPKESPFDLVAYSDRNYHGATQDRKSTTRGCQFLGRRLISWQCKKQKIMATSTIETEYVAAASGCGQVLWIQNQMLDDGYNFMNTKIYNDNNNAICIVKNLVYHSKIKHIEIRHHFIRDCFEKKLINVDHIHTDDNVADLLTKPFDVGRFQYLVILATIDGKTKTIFESSIMRNLKLNDEEGICSLPDAELFENLALMGYNILPNQKFTFQKGQFSHQWKFLIHTIMQCLSPKSIGFNEFSSNIATAVVCLATNRVYNFSKMIIDVMVRNVNNKEIPTLRQYSRRATRISQSKALPTAADEHASLLRDDSQGEAFLTVTSLDAGQDMENIIKTSALPHYSTPRVTSLDADEGSMQQKLQELMDLCTGLQRQQTQMATKIKAQDLEISGLKARIKLLKDKDKGSEEPSGDDAPIKGRSIEIGEEVKVERSTERGSNDTEEMVNVLTSMDAANILTSGVADVSVPPAAEVSTIGVPTVTKDKGKEKVVEFDTPKKKKLQEQIDAQVAKEMEEEIAREDQRMNEQLARDAEIARIHAEKELKMMIEGLDRSNEMIEKHLQ